MMILCLLAAIVFETAPADTVLIPVRSQLPNILFDVRYATTNNFTGKQLYASSNLLLRKVALDALCKAQEECMGLGFQLKIFDAYRPLSVQKILWSIVPDERYVADPAKGSRHNRGCAVDVTLCTADGQEVPMGTDYDEFTEAASAAYQHPNPTIVQNRNVLQRIMSNAGFVVLPTEWWHFDLVGWEKYGVLDE
jgi:zinc D-Ala-D-Ala dipeptidase